MSREHPVIAGIRWILENRTHVVDGEERPFNPTSLSLAAGLSRGHVEQMLSGRHKGDVKRSTALALARAGNVRLEWLQTGAGEREPFEEPELGAVPARHVERVTDIYASFEQWLALADGGKGLVPGIVNALRVEARRDRNSGGDPGVAHWSRRYKELLTEKKGVDELRTLTPDDLE